MYSLSDKHERRLLWLLALTQFTIIMDFMVMMPLGPQIMHAFAITPWYGNHKTLTFELIASFSQRVRLA